VLRREGDRRPAAVVKLRALRALGERYRLLVLVDDDPAVVRAVRRAGIVSEVIRADWQPRSQGVDEAQRGGRT
jgi:beta-phosphoglucomutase-like phosphatase (HAD superfamily)